MGIAKDSELAAHCKRDEFFFVDWQIVNWIHEMGTSPNVKVRPSNIYKYNISIFEKQRMTQKDFISPLTTAYFIVGNPFVFIIILELSTETNDTTKLNCPV